ncbi:MAG: ABC transporter substrate-binding protein [Chloroflexota bacterium]|nr:ABC transporter substrate-binding protein [Chloroflexota bacterium]
MKRLSSVFTSALPIVVVLALFLAVACGPAATPTPTPAPTATPTPTTAAVPTPTATATKPAPTPTLIPVVATPTPTATQAKPPATPTTGARPVPGSKLVVAVADAGPANYYGYEVMWPYTDRNVNLGIFDTLLDWTGMDVAPGLAEKWDMDSGGMTFYLRQGVQFHSGWGEVTAEDVIFSWVDTNREGTKKGNIEAIRNFSEYQQVSKYVIRMPWKEGKPLITWRSPTISALIIQSKRFIQEKGAQFANLNAVGTGPYRVTAHKSDDYIYMEAVPNHWRKTGAFQTVQVLEIPEESTRIAMLKTKEADIIELGIAQIGQVKNEPGVRIVTGAVAERTGASVFLPGQHYAKPENPWIKGLKWVGDPNDPASMESARNVRKAFSYAIDRKAIIDVVLGGLGCAQYQYRVDACNPNWDKKWETPYDPAKAKEFLAKAGYPNGFSFAFFIPMGTNSTMERVGEALVPMWEAVGLKATIQKAAYSSRRPEMLARTISDVWVFIHGGALTPEGVHWQMGELGGDGVWNMGAGWPQSRDLATKIRNEADMEKGWQIVKEWLDWLYVEQPVVQTVTWVDPWAVGPKVGNWEMPVHIPRWPNFIYNIELAR